ncbi:MAG: heme exporter protein CcmB [Saprospiraceae bacterium]|nr:heme exporter protein CcmB [Saprospiraceae bacterium]
MNRILTLVATEARIELRERYALSGIVLYVLSSSFIVFSIWRQLPAKEWGLTFWVIFLFCSLMAVLKTFGKESEGRYFYYYTLYHPLELFVAKVLYNLFLLLFIFLVLWFVLYVMAGNHIIRFGWFLTTGLMACTGLSFLLTLITSIAIKTQQNASLTAVMALPLMIPLLINILRLTAYASGTTPDENPWNEMMLLSSIISLVVGMSLWLFPYLWRS